MTIDKRILMLTSLIDKPFDLLGALSAAYDLPDAGHGSPRTLTRGVTCGRAIRSRTSRRFQASSEAQILL